MRMKRVENLKRMWKEAEADSVYFSRWSLLDYLIAGTGIGCSLALFIVALVATATMK
ncbi:MAG: hypothetical protein L3J71_03640 [Victivallaceae bacterium]|nr:hypothetical protein [Victivallaceae bacterium]